MGHRAALQEAAASRRPEQDSWKDAASAYKLATRRGHHLWASGRHLGYRSRNGCPSPRRKQSSKRPSLSDAVKSLSWPKSRLQSANPANRRPFANVARSSGRWIGIHSRRSETRNEGSSSRRRSIARCASTGWPASAWLAAMISIAIRKLGKLLSERESFYAAMDDREAAELQTAAARINARHRATVIETGNDLLKVRDNLPVRNAEGD